MRPPKVVRRITSQFAGPHGPAAPVVAALMNRTNRGLNTAAIDALDLRGEERVLDVGFGGGVGLAIALNRINDDGRVVGVERSADMIARARSRFAGALDAGRLQLAEGTVENIPLPDGHVDAATR